MGGFGGFNEKKNKKKKKDGSSSGGGSMFSSKPVFVMPQVIKKDKKES